MEVSKTNMFARNWRSKLKQKMARNGSPWEPWISWPDRSAWNFEADPTVTVPRAITLRNGPKMQKTCYIKKLGWRSKIGSMLKRKMVVFGCFLHHFLTLNNESCAKFSCESSRDGLKCLNPQIWAKMRPKIFRFLTKFSRFFWGGAESKETLPCIMMICHHPQAVAQHVFAGGCFVNEDKRETKRLCKLQ